MALKAFLKEKYLGSSICAGGGHLLSLTQEADKVPPPAAPGLPLRPPAPGIRAGGREEGETLYTQLDPSSQGVDPPADPTGDGGRPFPPAGPQSTDLAADTAACTLDSTAVRHPPCLLCLFSEAQCPGHPRPPRVCVRKTRLPSAPGWSWRRRETGFSHKQPSRVILNFSMNPEV